MFATYEHYLALSNELAELFSDRFDFSQSRPTKIGQVYEFAHSSILGIRTAYNKLPDGRIQSIFQIGGSIINSIDLRKWVRFCTFTLYPLHGFCSRFDIFADDFSGAIAKVRSEILALCQFGDPQLVSGFRRFEPISSGDVGGLQLQTLYLGSRQSDKYLRIYDKIKVQTEDKGEENEQQKRREKPEENGGEKTEENGGEKTEEKLTREKRREAYFQRRREEKKARRKTSRKGFVVSEVHVDSSRIQKLPDIYTRWEVEYKSDVANNIFRFFCEWYRSNCSSEDIMQELQGFMRDLIFSGYNFFSQRLNASLQRKNIVASWWQEFLHLVQHSSFKLPIVRPVKTIERTISFLERQVATSLALARRYMGMNFSNWLDSLYRSGDDRLSDAQLLMLELAMKNGH
jgi:hypothetical protein